MKKESVFYYFLKKVKQKLLITLAVMGVQNKKNELFCFVCTIIGAYASINSKAGIYSLSHSTLSLRSQEGGAIVIRSVIPFLH
jgi:hypothetical protein